MVKDLKKMVKFLEEHYLVSDAIANYSEFQNEIVLALALIKFGGEEAGITAFMNVAFYMYYCGYQKALENKMAPWVVQEEENENG